MSDKKAKIPQIRFAGFEGEWEERKLGELATFINGRAYSQNELLSNGKYKVLRVGNFYTNDSWYYSDMELGDKYYAEFGDLLYTWSATFGPHIWLGDKVIYHYHIWKIEISEQLEKKFVVQLLEKDKSAILSNKNGSAMLHITKGGMESKVVIIPSNINEQAQIGSFFLNLDNLISLQQRQLDKLASVKKTMLEKMFPKDGANEPEIRFAGFTGAWEERKFVEIFTFLRNNSLSRADLNYETGLVKNVHYGDVLIKFGEILDVEKDEIPFISNDEFSFSSTSFLQNGDVIIADAAEDETVGKCSEIKGLDGMSVVSGLHTIPCRPNWSFATGYLGYFMNSRAYHDQLLPLIQGTKISSISKSALQNTEVIYPVTEEEQKQIGAFFQHLDNLLTLHQRELNTLNTLKKSMLQQLFV